jgi:hypothetical protein
MNEILVLFYSRFYEKSLEMKEFMEYLDNVRILNVDNKNISDKIVNDTTYSIKHVPSILLLKEDGSVQLYEKESAISYYDSLRDPGQPYEHPPSEQEEPAQNKNMSVMDIAKMMENGRG